MKPNSFLRWIGGKTKIINDLIAFIPTKYNCYWEPFLGGGSMFFKLTPRVSILSDSNYDLINCYMIAKEKPNELYNQVEYHRKNHSGDYYYHTRDLYNQGGTDIEQAGRFLYLNKTCFNGIFRVNKDGKFNVPYGYKVSPSLPTLYQLIEISNSLQNAELFCCSYQNIQNLKEIQPQDFIYFDPPYPPINEKSHFNHYSATKFNIDDQYNLSEFAKKLFKQNCKVMISNVDTPEIRDLYKNWNIVSLPVIRWVSANGVRAYVNELVIFNYELEEGQKDVMV